MADDKHWMAGAVKNKGGLHRALGISTDKKIPASRIKTALGSRNPRVRRMASLAETFAKARR